MFYLKKKGAYWLSSCPIVGITLWLLSSITYAMPSDSDLSVWANEAIVSAYTFDANNFLARQQSTAKYFTTEAWINYTRALQAAKLLESVQKHNYAVSAVALLPPTVKLLKDSKEWQAKMPLLVLYKGSDYQQKQSLEVVITFQEAKKNEGIRGLALTSFTTSVTTPACRCDQELRAKAVVNNVQKIRFKPKFVG